MSNRGKKGLCSIAPPGVPPERMVVGLTGNPGAGKSTVASIMKSLGACIIDVDRLGHQLLVPGTPVYRELIREFGTDLLDPEGYIDRTFLGQIVFEDPDQLQRLNDIVHPVLIQNIQDAIHRFRTSTARGPLVIDAALIFEWRIERFFDAIVAVTASEEQRKKRFLELRRLSAEEFERRNAAQIPDADKTRQADAVFHNEGDLAGLRLQVEQFMKN